MPVRALRQLKNGPPYLAWDLRRFASLLSLFRHPNFLTYCIKDIYVYFEEDYELCATFSSDTVNALCREARRAIKMRRWTSGDGSWRTWYSFDAYIAVRRWIPITILCDCLTIPTDALRSVHLCSPAGGIVHEKQVNGLRRKFHREITRQVMDAHYDLLRLLFEFILYDVVNCQCHLNYIVRSTL